MTWEEVTLAALDYARRLQATLGAYPSESIASPAMSQPTSPARSKDETRLTRREREVLALLATGASNTEIAARLGLSTKTSMHHSMSIYAKLGVRGRAEAAAWAFRNGVVASEK